MPDQLITYVLENGGIWGFLFVLSIAFNILIITKPNIFGKKTTDRSSKENEEIKMLLEIINATVGDVKTKVDNLDVLHSLKDEDGVPVWYVKKSLTDNISEIKTNTFKIIEIDNKLVDKQLAIVSGYDAFINDYRAEYKDLITEYHSTLQELVVGLEKLKLEIQSGD